MSIESSDKNASTTNHAVRKKFVGFVSLLGSGVISAVGFMLIASQRWSLFDQRLAAFIILFVQWQILGFAVSKIGIEHLIFAVVSNDEKKHFAAGRFLGRTVAPLAVVFSIAIGYVFTPWAGVVAFGTILLDAYSIIISADLNARGFYTITSISNLINYPLFFITLFALNYAGVLNAAVALTVFLFSSLLRALWLARKRHVPVLGEEFASDVNVKMGVQQVFNFLLYRIDQILLAVIGLKDRIDENVSLYIYLAKFPEILASVIVIVGTVTFPRAYVQYPFTMRSLLSRLKGHQLLFLGYIAAFTGMLYAYLKLWSGQADPFSLAPPFLLNALLIIVANNMSYSMLRQGYLRKLIINMAAAVAIGVSLSILLRVGGNIYALSWIVPIQMVSFIALSLTTPWGERIELYA